MGTQPFYVTVSKNHDNTGYYQKQQRKGAQTYLFLIMV